MAAADIAVGAAMVHAVGRQDVAGLVGLAAPQPGIKRGEVLVGLGEQGVEPIDDEIALLEIVDPVLGAHHPLQVEADAVGRGALDRMDRFRPARHDARTVDAQAVLAGDQPELDRVPIEPRQILQRVEFVQRPHPALAISLHVIGEDRMSQHRHMAEHVVEDVRLLDIVELVGAPDELAGGKAAVGEVVEEDLVGHQRRHGDDAPAGQLLKPVRQPLEIGNGVGHQVEPLQPVEDSSQARPGSTLAWRSNRVFQVACSAAP
ncbi:MAG: hypothetical protein WDM86_21390 [Rhizomicrobium sp.]